MDFSVTYCLGTTNALKLVDSQKESFCYLKQIGESDFEEKQVKSLSNDNFGL